MNPVEIEIRPNFKLKKMFFFLGGSRNASLSAERENRLKNANNDEDKCIISPPILFQNEPVIFGRARRTENEPTKESFIEKSSLPIDSQRRKTKIYTRTERFVVPVSRARRVESNPGDGNLAFVCVQSVPNVEIGPIFSSTNDEKEIYPRRAIFVDRPTPLIVQLSVSTTFEAPVQFETIGQIKADPRENHRAEIVVDLPKVSMIEENEPVEIVQPRVEPEQLPEQSEMAINNDHFDYQTRENDLQNQENLVSSISIFVSGKFDQRNSIRHSEGAFRTTSFQNPENQRAK